MTTAASPADEPRRLAALRRYNVLDSLPERALDDLAVLAARICDTPIALVELLDERRAWVMSAVGMARPEIPRDGSFCASAIAQSDIFQVADAAADPRFAANPLVAGTPGIRFYAGVPLVTPDGQALGALAVLDRVPRRLTANQEDGLRILGRQVMAQLELRRQTVELSQSQASLIQAFRDCPVPLAIHQWPGRTFVHVNAAFTGLVGWTRDELFGRTMIDLGILDAARAEPLAASLSARRTMRDVEMTVTTRTGERRDVLAETALVDVGGGQQAITTLVDITGRKRIEAALRESEERLRLALEAAQMGTFDWDMAADRLTWSRWHEQLWGFAPGEFGGTYDAFAARLHPDDLGPLNEEVARCLAARATFQREFRVVWPDGSAHWVAGRGEFSFDADGRPVRMRGTVMDTTVRKQSEQALLEHKNRLAAIVETEPECVKVIDRFGALIEMNSAGLAMLEADSLAEARECKLTDYLEPEYRAGFRDLLERVLLGGHGTFEFEICGRRGTRRWLETHAAPLRDGEGRIHALLGVTRDITERRKAERRVRQLNRVYAVLSEINETIVRERDPGAMLQAACRIAVDHGQFAMAWIGLVDPATGRVEIAADAGASDETLVLIRSLVNGDGRDGGADCAVTLQALGTGQRGLCNDIAADPRAAGWRAAALERGYRAMASLPLKTGDRVRGAFNLYAVEPDIFDDEEIRLLGELATDISFALDIHDQDAERRRIEEALRDSEERFRQLAENIQEVFWMTEPATRQVVYVSPVYQQIWGRTCASLYESVTTWEESLHPDDRERILEASATKQERGDFDETYRILRPDGTARWIRDRAFPIRSPDGAITRIVGVAEDITERRQLEDQLRQSQKMDAIGQLAGGVAHDFNNILAAIMMQAELAAFEANPPATIELLDDIKASAGRAANLTRQLLAFSRRQVMQSRPIDINEIVVSLTKMLHRILGEDVSLQLSLHPQKLVANVDSGMLDQVLLNLVVNARDAMPAGGRLVIQTFDGALTDAEAALIPDAAPGPYVSLRVTDTGKGISREHLPRIFEPFFTTKESGKGTGLGLATVFGIIRQHGGWLTVDSRPGHTSFGIFLRAVPGASAADVDDRPAGSLRRGTETILLVEDEPSVRTLTRVVLERQGYRVLEASHGAAALRLWEQHKGDIALLLTDIVMPEGMTGRDLAARLRVSDPGLRVIFTSGYSADLAGRELDLQEGQNFIQKPFSPRRLLECIERCLDR